MRNLRVPSNAELLAKAVLGTLTRRIALVVDRQRDVVDEADLKE
jgi:hypothetical protein